jgi:hypothetical protein
MNIHKMIAELQTEKERLDEAIVALERLSAGSKAKRRTRPLHGATRESAQSEEPESAAPKARSHSS